MKDFVEIENETDDRVRPAERKKRRKSVVAGSKAAAGEERGVVYLSHVPPGFHEREMRRFFSQFGTVTDLRVGRSRRTGRARGYAFVEFRYEEVARIAAETMDNYLMFERLMKCRLVPRERVRPQMFRGKVDPDRPPLAKARRNAKKVVNAPRDERREAGRRRGQFASLQRAARKLEQFGVRLEVDLPDVVREKKERAERLRSGRGRTPVMQVDDSDGDVTLKTPPNVRKIKSRGGSARADAVTPRSAKLSASVLARKLARKAEGTGAAAAAKTPVAGEEPAPKRKNLLFRKSTPRSARKATDVKSSDGGVKKRKSLT